MKIFVTGISGTGKTTLAEYFASNGYNVIDLDHVPNLCSWIDYKTGEKTNMSNTENVDNEFIDTHDYVCDVRMLEEMLNQHKENVIVFGVVGDNSSLTHLFDKIILLQCSPENMIQRIENRKTNYFGKNKEVKDRMLSWQPIFESLMIGTGATVVNTDCPIDEVIEKVKSVLAL